jgi:hypothetical protein
MAFPPQVTREGARARAGARARREGAGSTRRRFVRHSALGTQAVYEIVEEGRKLVTVEVVAAPGLAPGTQVRLLASAARAMDEVAPEQVVHLLRHGHNAADTPPRAA